MQLAPAATPPVTGPRSAGQRWPLGLLRPLPALGVLALAVQVWTAPASSGAVAGDATAALASALAHRGLEVDPREVAWIDPPGGALASVTTKRRVALLGHRAGEPADVYLARVRLSPEGKLLEVHTLYNVSDTSAVDERGLAVRGETLAWVIGGGGRAYSVHTADLSARGDELMRGFTRRQRLQQRITNWQTTGQTSGVGRRSFRLDPTAEQVTITFTDDAVLVDADGRRIRLEPSGVTEGSRWVSEQPHYVSRPGNLVTWAVDRVRALPWFGSDKMQALKAVAFAGLDWVQRVVGTVTGDDGSSRVAEELAGLLDAPLVEHTDPDSGFPPPALTPVLSPPLEDEGKWRPLDKDPFVLTNPHAPAPFVTTFIRTDRRRAYSQIFITLWDPRQVALHAMSGTLEPKSATGETGPGLVPRKPEVIGRLLGGFNGGFQATHGEFGMVADGVVYLPPKPYAASVAELSDGSTGFGTWPESDAVPETIRSMRQNMTPLVMDGAINPYKRDWWGGVPPGWTDEARTVRSGVCLTREKFVAYFYGSTIDAEHLALAMQSARCEYGIHLDMNPGHSGLEFYRTAPRGQLPDVGHKLDPQWESSGPIPDLPGWEYQGRRMLRYMALMNFPRYIQREARDFFYLTLRHVLPGEPVATAVKPAEANEGQWQLSGLPQHGWPHALATTSVRPDQTRPEARVRLLKVDPRALRVAATGPVVLAASPASEQGPGLFFDGARFSIGANGSTRLMSGSVSSAGAIAAAGIDSAGFLLYAVVGGARAPERDGKLLEDLLRSLGATELLFSSAPWDVAIGGDRDLAGHPLGKRAGAVRLARGDAPGGRRLFPETAIVAPKIWYPLQARRVRYFRKPKPAEGAPEGAPAPAPPAPDPP